MKVLDKVFRVVVSVKKFAYSLDWIATPRKKTIPSNENCVSCCFSFALSSCRSCSCCCCGCCCCCCCALRLLLSLTDPATNPQPPTTTPTTVQRQLRRQLQLQLQLNACVLSAVQCNPMRCCAEAFSLTLSLSPSLFASSLFALRCDSG